MDRMLSVITKLKTTFATAANMEMEKNNPWDCCLREVILQLSRDVSSDLEQTQFSLDLSNFVLNEVTPVAWDASIWKLALEGGKAYLGQILDQSLYRQQCWLWYPGSVVEMEDIPSDVVMLGCLLAPIHILANAEVGLALIAILSTVKQGWLEIPFVRWMGYSPFGEPIQDENIAPAVAATTFLETKVTLDKMKMSRQQRRCYERKYGKLPDVNVITLRRAHQEQGDKEAVQTSSREYQCQWPVRSHWRQPSKRSKTGLATRVHSYTKGPADKPLKVATPTLYKANR